MSYNKEVRHHLGDGIQIQSPFHFPFCSNKQHDYKDRFDKTVQPRFWCSSFRSPILQNSKQFLITVYVLPVNKRATPPNAAFNSSSKPLLFIKIPIHPIKLINICMPPSLGKKLGNNSGCTHITFTMTLYNCWSAVKIVYFCPHLTVSLCALHMVVIIVSGSD